LSQNLQAFKAWRFFIFYPKKMDQSEFLENIAG
jgi:hypothetical protein